MYFNMADSHLDHSLERNEHRAETLVDGEQVKQAREVENVADGEQTLAHVHRVPRVPVIPIYSVIVIVSKWVSK